MIRRKAVGPSQRGVLHPSRTAHMLLRDSKALRPDLSFKRQRTPTLGETAE